MRKLYLFLIGIFIFSASLNAQSKETITDDNNGYANTNETVCFLGDGGGEHYVVKTCYELEAFGYNDVYLTSKGELQTLFDNKEEISGIVELPFWSSTEYQYELFLIS